MITDLHRWIIGRLTGDAVLTDVLGDPPRVHDVVPPRRALPCLVVGTIEASDNGTDDEAGQAFLTTLRAFSRAPDRVELYAIADRVRVLFDGADAIQGQTRIVLGSHVASVFSNDRDARLFSARLRFRFLCEDV